MTGKSIQLTDRLYEYLLDHSLREPAILRRLREETASHPMARMQIAPEQGQFMAWLVEALRVRRALEIGVFTGYSALWVARALAPEGKLVACDVSDEWTQVARRYWQEAGVDDRIDLRLAPALDTLGQLLDDGAAGTFDFAFIDADKVNYDAYYEKVLQLLRPGGVVIFDNVLWSGDVADPVNQDDDTNALRRINDKLYSDERVALSMLPVADGLTLALKR